MEDKKLDTITIRYICRNCGYRDEGDVPIEDGEYLEQNPRCNQCGNDMVENKDR